MTQHNSSDDLISLEHDVVAEWIDPHLPTVFSRWHDFHERCFADVSHAICEAAMIRPGDVVLDIGSGSGIPAPGHAQTVGLTGEVVATDLSPVFLAALKHNARRLGLTNLRAVQASATNLPSRDGGFDSATCQMGVMFFPDVDSALHAVRHRLRAGGRFALSAWGPIEENALFTAFGSAIGRFMPPPADAEVPTTKPEDVPGPDRFSTPGSLSSALKAAGFSDVHEELIRPDLIWPGPAESIRDFFQEMSRFDQQVEPDRLADCRAEVAASFARYADGDTIRLPSAIVIAWGQT